jgi:hypothetical protein
MDLCYASKMRFIVATIRPVLLHPGVDLSSPWPPKESTYFGFITTGCCRASAGLREFCV